MSWTSPYSGKCERNFKCSHDSNVKPGCITRDTKACFKRPATAVPNSIDRIKFNFSTAVARRLKPSRANAV